MKKTIVIAVIVAVIAIAGGVWLVASSGSGSKPDMAGCKAAISAQLEASVNDALAGLPVPTASKPKACNGLSDSQLNEVVNQIMNAG